VGEFESRIKTRSNNELAEAMRVSATPGDLNHFQTVRREQVRKKRAFCRKGTGNAWDTGLQIGNTGNCVENT